MVDEQDNIAKFQEKLNELIKKQEYFKTEIDDLQKEIYHLQSKQALRKPEITLPEQPAEQTVVIETHEDKMQEVQEITSPEEEQIPDFRVRLEKFIGENLINKIGIVITVIGVGIGAKYAIDHQLISPLTRIILGYLLGLGLLGFAVRLRRKYENFSAVLLSGSMAIMYFITFAAYSFYGLIPVAIAFMLMVLFTFFTVAAAIRYDRQVIAHIGLVGAYAVPFLLSEGAGKVVILFTYMAIINTGILVIAFRKYWKPLYYSSFLITWLIFLTWYIPKYETAIHFGLSWIFISIFFVTFYIIILAYKLLKKEKFALEDILLLLANSSVFYGLGYAILHRHIRGEDFLGLFTLGNAMIHLVVSILIHRQKQADRNLFFFTIGLALAFLTIAIPVQLDGNWVTLLWSAEAAVLFWIGRTKNASVYELLSYPLMILAFFSINIGWPSVYHTIGSWPAGERIIPLANINFLTSSIFIVSFAFINILNGNRQFQSPLHHQTTLLHTMNFIVPAMFLLVLYFAFEMEIVTIWKQLYANTAIMPTAGLTIRQPIHDDTLAQYKTISVLIYSLLFFSVLSFANMRKLKNRILGLITLGFSAIVLCAFLTAGLFALGSLRESYLDQTLSEYYYRGIMAVGIRYISFLFVALLLYAVYKCIRQDFLVNDLQMGFDFLLHITLLTIISNELINWMDLFRSEQSYKLGLSILFGVYSLLLIVLGIWKKKLHLRIGAIVLFSITLLKLFFYDLTSLDTISKTIVFVVLGLLLLVISFLYTKYKKLIFEDREG